MLPSIRDGDPSSKPVINLGVLTHPSDQVKAVEAVRLARSLFYSDALGELLANRTSEGAPGWEFQTDGEILAWIKGAAITYAHAACTCKMGTDSDDSAVVDPQLRVRGTRNLRVVDASVMPQLVSGNTNSVTMIIAFKGADLILEDH